VFDGSGIGLDGSGMGSDGSGSVLDGPRKFPREDHRAPGPYEAYWTIGPHVPFLGGKGSFWAQVPI
jgi:hypothetical protein